MPTERDEMKLRKTLEKWAGACGVAEEDIPSLVELLVRETRKWIEEENLRKEVVMAKEEFVREYMMSGPFSEYINMVEFTRRFIAEWKYRGGDPAEFIEGTAKIEEELIQAGEDPEELVLFVGLEKPLPEGMSLPKTYKGFKVFVGVIGEIRAF